MPGAGKSTVGVILAKLTGLPFNDTDLAIQVREHATLQEIVDRHGYETFRKIEEEVLLATDLADTVVSTGGSVIYSEAIMARLHAAGPVVYLVVDLPTLEQRIAAAPLRGIASDTGRATPPSTQSAPPSTSATPISRWMPPRPPPTRLPPPSSTPCRSPEAALAASTGVRWLRWTPAAPRSAQNPHP